MLEYNGDTATVILESGPAQRAWLESKRQRAGEQGQSLYHLQQFNSIEKELKAAWCGKRLFWVFLAFSVPGTDTPTNICQDTLRTDIGKVEKETCP
jgi:glutathionylspermidine synthase